MAKVNKELKKMYDDDVKEKTEADWDDKEVVAKINENDKKRKKRVDEIIAEGGLRVAADYHHVALIFQHGDTADDYKKANELAKKGMEMGDERSKWLYAATLDRWLVSQGKPQKYGTQFKKNERDDWDSGQIDPTTTDEERARFNVPPVSEALARFKEKYRFS
jgi:hypothetical protein